MAEPGSSQFIQTLRALLAAAEAGQIPGTITPAASPSAIPAPAPAPAPAPQASAPQPAAPQQQQPQSSSLLQQLRERATRELAGTSVPQEDPRVAFGRGLLSNRGSFLDNLSAGLQAQREAETAQQTALAAQREEMRRIAEAERQEQARRDLAEYQRRSLELRQQEAERNARPQFQVVGQDERGNAVVMDPRDPTRRQVLEGVTPMQALRMQPRPLSQADIAVISQRALARANTDVGILPGIAPTPAQITRRDELQRQYLAEELERARQGLSGTPQTGGSGTPGAPAAVIDARGNAVNPPR